MARGEERKLGRTKEEIQGEPKIKEIRERLEANRRSKREKKREITVKDVEKSTCSVKIWTIEKI